MLSLNNAQKQAVTEGSGPALVLAGAGSGKTRVIVERIVYLVDEEGVDPRNILAVTFTNRAATEMRERVAERLGVSRLGAWVGTFHSFGLYVLRREMERLGRAAAFTIFDDADQMALMKRLVRDLPETAARVTPREALQWVSRLKQDLNEPPPPDAGEDPSQEAYRALWKAYHAALARSNAVDFDDLLVLPARLFQEQGEAREKYARRYRHVLVDEYQDTNHAQYVLATLLASVHGNLFAVGDEDQSIYSWRGANIRNILEFEEDFPEARVFRLEDNYRSTGPILSAANAVVANNLARLGKTLRATRPGKEPVRVFSGEDGEEEARFVADDIVERQLDTGTVAILFRTHAQSRLIEEALRRKSLAYKLLGGTEFYGRKEVKDLLAYLRLVANPEDDEALLRVVNVPARGIGAKSVEQLRQYAADRGVPLLRILRDALTDQTFTPRVRESAAAFVHLIDDLALTAKDEPLARVVGVLLDRTEYRDYVRADDEKNFRDRLDIVEEFVSACTEFDEAGGGGLLEYLQDLALLSPVDQLEETPPAVLLMTCHNAKGLEFEHVYLIGLEEGLLPHSSAFDSEDEVEEERRLCYVAMTRARETLTLTHARWRTVYGESRRMEPSRFLDEMPRGELSFVGVRDKARAEPRPDPAGADPSALKNGTRVRHARFGTGVVQYTMGSGDKMRARIRFETGRARVFLVKAAPLEIIHHGERR